MKFIVIDTTFNPLKRRVVSYVGDYDENDVLFCVEEFFEEAGVRIDEDEIVELASELSRKRWANWETFHFEVIQ